MSEEDRESEAKIYQTLCDIIADRCLDYHNVQLVRAYAFHIKLLKFAPTVACTDTKRAESIKALRNSSGNCKVGCHSRPLTQSQTLGKPVLSLFGRREDRSYTCLPEYYMDRVTKTLQFLAMTQVMPFDRKDQFLR